MSKIEFGHNTHSVDLSHHNAIFCDSLQALEWAYQNGLPETAIIKTSAPALLWEEKANIQHVEARWIIEEMGEFQSTIQKFSEDVFDATLNVAGMEREQALAVSQAAAMFQKVLYKAACLEEQDFYDPRLFIRVEGESGSAGNNMNSPWDQLLLSNPLFSSVSYSLQNDEWETLTTQGVSNWKRYKLAGVETIIYRLAIRLMKQLPDGLFKREILVPNENELVIETAASLALRGVKVSELKPEPKVLKFEKNIDNLLFILDVILPIIQARVEKWVVPSAVEVTMSLFKGYLEKHLNQFDYLATQWDQIVTNSSNKKRAVLMNAPGNLKGQTLASVCRKNNVPCIAAQHGVTVEISKLHGELSVGFDNVVADCLLAYNSKITEVGEKSHFAKAKQYVVGASLRHIRMKRIQSVDGAVSPIVYISTNLYRGNLGSFISSKTDYSRARDEQKVVTEILLQLPHQVRYKTYPDDNRRFADPDPVLKDVVSADNIELFSDKVDMRYLLAGHRVLVTSSATSTLAWPVMTGKPVVFINWKYKSPLTDDAHEALSKGLFLFDDEMDEFYEKLRKFLSQPIEDIERQWEEKELAREEMIKEYFSAYGGGAGIRAAKMILQDYL
jgi:hypothetical protein